VAALGLSLASTGGLAAFFAFSAGQTGNQVAAASIVTSGAVATQSGPVGTATSAAPTTSTAAPDTSVPATAPPAAAAPQPVTLEVPAAASNTVVDGAVFHNKWGDVQVEATFGPDGSLIDVVTLQTPYLDGRSVGINDYAVPRLNSEALTAQTANVDTVSGATYTSNDYRRSLQSAIDAARAAGVTAVA
jgi:uncharacterized protein with FMN-binding domain